MPNFSALFLLALVLSLGARAQSSSPTFEDLALRAAAAREANDLSHAIDLYQQALATKPQWPEGLFYLGSLLYDSDQYAKGVGVLSRLVALQPDAAPAWGLLGLCEFETRDYSNALKHIQKNLTLDPKVDPQMSAVLRFHEAQLLARNGEFDQAVARYAGLAHAASPNADLLVAIGIAALRRPLVPSEIPADRQALFLSAGKAGFSTMAGDYSAADAAFSQLLGQFPSEPGVHYMHGLYLLAKAPSAALADLQKELDLTPSNAPAAATLAWLMLNRGDAALALPIAKQAVAGAPDLPIAQYAYGRSEVEAGNLAQGIEHLSIAVKLEPKNLESHLALVTAYSKAGRTADARSERTRSIALAQEASPVVQ